MARWAYVDGRFQPLGAPAIAVEDRGFQFSEGVYEVVAIDGGRLIDADPHLERLARSAAALRLAAPPTAGALRAVMAEAARRNRVRDGWVYLQWSGGPAPRDFAPARRGPCSLVVYARAKPVRRLASNAMRDGVRAVTAPDLRWRRRDVKTVSLLGACLAKQAAMDAGCFEAIQYEADGRVTEGASSNVWIVGADGALTTPPPSHDLLNGITRRVVLDIAAERGAAVREAWFDVAALKAAQEVFLTSASAFVAPVVRVDDAVIGDGRPGPFAQAALARYLDVDRPGPRAL